MHTRSSLALIGALSAPLLAFVACGGDSTTGAFSPPSSDAGTGGASPGDGGKGGGSGSASGGSGNGGTASGGSAGTGTGGATGGTAGSGGADGGGCRPPTSPNDTSLCVHLLPQDLKALQQPQLDQKGIFALQVFDTPNPPDQNADQVALATTVLPPGAALGDAGTGAEIALSSVSDVRVEGAFPATVYVRAFFVDNPEAIGRKDLGYGVWIGGIDLKDGLSDKEPLLPVPVTIGAGNSIDLSLTALRLLHVTVHLAATPVGDGQGPLTVAAVGGAEPSKKPPLYGFGARACVDLAARDVNVNGIVFGEGNVWVTGILNDLGLPGDLPTGSAASLEQQGATIVIPTKVNLGREYAIQTSIDLGFTVPWPADGGAIPPNSCADLVGAGADAGP
ncbi:MAG TPA: hypothetical protein VHE30_11365 [Polyangiaceae bacterium]|nr:hypothetical protein [Polyangiaceae bacterium]